MICLTFDIEERFHSHLTPDDAPRRWRARDRIAALLDCLEQRGVGATFFVVGELAERYPDLIRRMATAGFEVASHSHTHPRLDAPDRRRAMEDIARSKRVLEDLTGGAIHGFRAPSWSARRSDDWLWDHLLELRFEYDSSLFPFRTHLYGSFRNPTRPYRLRPGLLEIPPSVCRLGWLRVPYGGGFYFRLYPAWVTRWLVERDLRSGKAPIAYFHPWDFDTEPDRLESGPLNRFIGTWASGDTWHKFRQLVDRYPFRALDDYRRTLRDVAEYRRADPPRDGER